MRTRSSLQRFPALLILLLLTTRLAAADQSKDRDRNVIWKLEQSSCFSQSPGVAPRSGAQNSPCLQVNQHDVFFKSTSTPTRILTMPIRQVSGIEDPQVLASPGNLFADAWIATKQPAFVGGKENPLASKALPRNRLALGVNSRLARTQDQLHIHADCVSRGVSEELMSIDQRIRAQDGTDDRLRTWLPVRLSSADSVAANRNAAHGWGQARPQLYRIRKSGGEDLREDPFQLLAEDLRQNGGEMGRHALNVVGAEFPEGPGFFIIDVLADPAETAGADAEVIVAEGCP